MYVVMIYNNHSMIHFIVTQRDTKCINLMIENVSLHDIYVP